ncbi:hypothetical protein [Streptomyces sp. NBC_01716]|uniref:hypothetical protein n=1 Tax=Streptomyces sp. NBC_01716 TaxID=2975917 RepID=UPI002E2EBEC2|nr:hypothetical protein [Streptomyces sp. NBC_01716]
MTQSGQRDESQLPASRPAHEGIVLPADGGPPLIPGAPADQSAPADQTAPAGGQPWGQPWGPGAPQPQPELEGQLPPQQDPGAYGSYGGGGGGADGGYGYPQQPESLQQHYQPPQQQSYQPPQHQQPLPPAHPGPLPQALPPHQEPPQSYGPPMAGVYGAQPLPAEAPPGGSADATQYIPPVPAAAGPADATQYIPPVPSYQQGQTPGGLPPERPAESTQYLGTVQPGPPAQGTSDADATQFIAPVPAGDPNEIPAAPQGAPYGIRPGAPGDRQPPAEFDSLFRTEAPGGGGAVPDETQQLPQIDPGAGTGRRRGGQARTQQPHGQQGYGATPPPYAQQGAPQQPSGPQGRAAGRRKSSPVPLIAAVVVGCAVLGLGAGWLMSGDDSEKQDKNQTVSSESSPSGQGGDPAEEDPAKPQAEELDKLLAESNDSRSAVISAVDSIKSCKNLDQAVTDLQDAADQRRDLVSRLKELTLDKLPQHARLSNSLTNAWQASASADDHYATWATEAKTKKGCRGGKARTTKAAAEGNRASGEATAAKQKASGLWNGIASKYGLTERAPTEL